MALIKAVECDGHECGKLMKADGHEFFSIQGNLLIGISGGIIGNNLDDEGKLKATSYLCFDCFEKATTEAKEIRAKHQENFNPDIRKKRVKDDSVQNGQGTEDNS